MKAQGITFESHTVSHPDLAQSDSSRQETELANSKQVLDKNSIKPLPPLFTLPAATLISPWN